MINERIAVLMEAHNLSMKQFSKRLGITSTSFFNIIRGRRSKPSFELIVKILLEFPDLNPDWLILGEGSMWRPKTGILSHIDKSTNEIEEKLHFLIEDIRLEQYEPYQVHELAELVDQLNKKYRTRLRELVKTKEKQEEIIKTLKEMKGKL